MWIICSRESRESRESRGGDGYWKQLFVSHQNGNQINQVTRIQTGRLDDVTREGGRESYI